MGATPGDCCKAHSTSDGTPPFVQLSCFVPRGSASDIGDQHTGTGRCLDPVPLLAPAVGAKMQVPRCSTHSDCITEDSDGNAEEIVQMECVQPAKNSHLLRIAVAPPAWEVADATGRHSELQARIVLWDGPKEEVYEQSTRILDNR